MNSPAASLSAFAAYGIELEYMIVDRDSLAVRPIADALLQAMTTGEENAAAVGWSNELVLHVLELKNRRPSASLHELADAFGAEVAAANDTLAGWNARLMPSGMHPWMDPARETRLWPHQDAAIYRAYDRIFDCRSHGWANIQSMQLNLPFADDREFARLHAAVRTLLPILPALAASSPIAGGQRCRHLDFRMECYRLHPARLTSLIGCVIPENAETRAGYEQRVLAPMYADVAPYDAAGVLRAEWLNARGAIPRFDRNAIEIRVLDMQECPRADIAVAAAAGAVARAAYQERWASFAEQRAMSTEALAAVFLDVVRDGDAAIIDHPTYLRLFGRPAGHCRADVLWRHLVDACADDPLLDEDARAALAVILEQGPLARRILRAAGHATDRARLAAVYSELCDCLAGNRLFLGTAP